MIRTLSPDAVPLKAMTRRPSTLYYKGRADLLEKRMISIVGTRRPNGYTKRTVLSLASKLATHGLVVVSGAAMGVDALAHRGAGSDNTVAVMGCGLRYRYPAVNAALIEEIEKKGLVLSQFEPDFKARHWSFVVRNELVVALGEVLVVAQADIGSGSLRSAQYARKMGKKIYVLPHRIGESEGTNRLLKEGLAEAIWDIDEFVERITPSSDANGVEENDASFWDFCKTMPTYEEAWRRYADRLTEAELEGRIRIVDGRIVPL